MDGRAAPPLDFTADSRKRQYQGGNTHGAALGSGSRGHKRHGKDDSNEYAERIAPPAGFSADSKRQFEGGLLHGAAAGRAGGGGGGESNGRRDEIGFDSVPAGEEKRQEPPTRSTARPQWSSHGENKRVGQEDGDAVGVRVRATPTVPPRLIHDEENDKRNLPQTTYTCTSTTWTTVSDCTTAITSAAAATATESDCDDDEDYSLVYSSTTSSEWNTGPTGGMAGVSTMMPSITTSSSIAETSSVNSEAASSAVATQSGEGESSHVHVMSSVRSKHKKLLY